MRADAAAVPTPSAVVALEPRTVREAVERLRRVPDAHREFTEPLGRVVRFYGIPRPLLDQLLDLGLPHRRRGEQWTFWRRDLENLLLAFQLPCPQIDALKLMGAVLDAGTTPVVARELNLTGRCPTPGHEGACDFALSEELARAPHVAGARRIADHHHQWQVALPGGPPTRLDFPPALTALVRDLDDVRFHHLPAALAADLGFLAEARLADCRLATRFLVSEGTRHGVRVRSAAGLMLTPPFPAAHSWIDVHTGEGWRPADPFFLTALVRWGILDPASWPAHRAPLGAYWRLGATEQPTLTHRGTPVHPSLLVR